VNPDLGAGTKVFQMRIDLHWDQELRKTPGVALASRTPETTREPFSAAAITLNLTRGSAR
jgi:hypothetical protein